MKFEIGAWIECNYASSTSIIAQISGENKIKENGIGREFPTSFTEGNVWSIWKPKPNEYHWFWNNPLDVPILAKLISSEQIFERPIEYLVQTPSCISKCLPSYTGLVSFKYCEPFIGSLPTNLKEDR